MSACQTVYTCIGFVNAEPWGRRDSEQEKVQKSPKEAWYTQKEQQDQSYTGGAVPARKTAW